MKIIQITENMSHTSKRLHDIEKEKGVTPGTPEWFKLWFNLPYLKESITEAFDNPYKFKVTHKSGDRWEAQSLTDNNVIIFFLASNVDTGWGIDFKTADADNPTNTTYDLTGKGDGQRTMTTVLAMLKQFISQYSPEEIYFDAAKDAGNSRTSLYQKLLQRFAGGLGYKVDVKDKGSRDDFTLVKIDETAFNESLDNPYPYNWDSTHDKYAEFGNDSFLAKAEMDMGELMVMFTLGKPGVSWTIDFAVDGAMDKTGDGDQFRIFATVVAVIKDWMANKVDLSKVTQIDFSSDKDGAAEDSRSKLYKRFGQQLASKLGWNLEITDRGQFASFKIKNPNAPVEETVNEATEMKISDLTISDAGMAIAQSAGGGSRTDAPLTVTKLPSGHVYLVNGYHRLIDAMKSGKDTVAVEYVPYEKVEILWKQEREDDIKYGKQFNENFADGKVKGKSRPGRVKKSGASCNGSVTELRAKAKKASGEKAKMYHWCANMKSGKKK